MDKVECAMGLTPHWDRGKADVCLWVGDEFTEAMVKHDNDGTPGLRHMRSFVG